MQEFLKTALSNRTAVAVSVFALAMAGLMFVTQLPIKLYPSTTKTRIHVRIPHPSYTAEDFADQYAEIITRALATVDGIDEIETTHNNGNTSYRIYFDWGFDGKEGKALISAAMGQIRSQLPEESDNYHVGYWAGRTVGFFSAAVYSAEMSADEIYALIEPKIRPRLDQVKGIDFARITNTKEIQVDIFIDPIKSLSFGLTAADIAHKIRNGYRDLSLGSFREGRELIAVRIRQEIDRLEDIKNVVLATRQGREIKLEDVAEVRVFQGLPYRLYSVDGQRAVTIFAIPDVDGNVRDMSESIKRIIADVQSTVPSHIKFNTLVDPAAYINNAIRNVILAAVIGGSLAIFVVLFFLGEFRNTLIIAISIPTSIVLSFILMRLFGVSINLISLGGLTLAVGMIIDSSIVVIENIHRHHRENPDEALFKVILQSVAEVRGAIIASTLTSLVVFLPLSFTAELTSAILGDLAETVVFALTCSLLVALIVVPVISYGIFRNKKPRERKSHNPVRIFADKVMPRFIDSYGRLLRHLLNSKASIAGILVLAFAALGLLVVFVAPKIDRLIMDKPDSNRITLRFTNLESKNEEELFEAIKPIESQLLADYGDKIENLFARMRGANRGAFTMSLHNLQEREEVIRDLKKKFPSNRSWRFDISRWDPAELPLPRSRDLRLSISGPERSQILDLMEAATDEIRKLKIYEEVTTEPTLATANEIVLKPRRKVLDESGVTLEKLTRIGRILLTGSRVIQKNHENEQLDIEVSYKEDVIRSAMDVQDFLVSAGEYVAPLKHFFDFTSKRGLIEIIARDGDETFFIEADMKEDEPNWKRKDFEKKVLAALDKNITIPSGYAINVEDTQKDVNEAIASLLIALAASIILVLVILSCQFNSLSLPLVIVMAVPLGLIGVILILFFAGSNIGLNSMLGTILLGGIVVNNSILIVDFYRQYRRDFNNKVDALVHCCQLRLTPILITTLTTILGMTPIAFAFGEGTNVIQPLGIAVCGGLGVSTLLTLFIIPSIINLLPEGSIKKPEQEIVDN